MRWRMRCTPLCAPRSRSSKNRVRKSDAVLKCDGIEANDDHREVRSCGADDLFFFFFVAPTFDIFDENL